MAGGDGEDGRFELMIMTADDEHRVLAASPTAMSHSRPWPQPDTVPYRILRLGWRLVRNTYFVFTHAKPADAARDALRMIGEHLRKAYAVPTLQDVWR